MKLQLVKEVLTQNKAIHSDIAAGDWMMAVRVTGGLP
jgi:hypothetical protein